MHLHSFTGVFLDNLVSAADDFFVHVRFIFAELLNDVCNLFEILNEKRETARHRDATTSRPNASFKIALLGHGESDISGFSHSQTPDVIVLRGGEMTCKLSIWFEVGS